MTPNGANRESLALTPKTQGQPWPMPQSYKPSNVAVPLDIVNFKFINVGANCEFLIDAYKRYSNIIFKSNSQSRSLNFKPESKSSDSLLNTLFVNSKTGGHGGPSFEMDESYTLSITPSGALLTSNETWGAIRGLETFSQIIYRLETGEFVVNATEIIDYPRFKHRGVLLDTSRHFLKKEYIFQNLEAMAQNKFNVFHWHIVDDQSFPYYSPSFPDLSGKGAYNSRTHIYTPEDVNDVIQFAKYRGIRVMVEFDSPGHTLSWGLGQPGLLTECYSGGQFNGNYGPINAALNTTFPFLKQFFAEVAQVFPDRYIFLGGDEVDFSCWKSNPTITAFMQKMGYGDDYSKFEEYYIQQLLDIISSLNKGYMIWQEVVDNGAKVASDTVIDVWKGGWETEMAKVTSHGYRCSEEFSTWWEAALWGGNMLMTLTLLLDFGLDASAIAERLWSPAMSNNFDLQAVENRLAEHRCRLIRKSIPAEEPIGPGYCDVKLLAFHIFIVLYVKVKLQNYLNDYYLFDTLKFKGNL
ncbi:hypothetical protein Btru_016508 [Bulinus truncatus]|nr:hypothetical protein Btru_016508 [Bulinus truncatus]